MHKWHCTNFPYKLCKINAQSMHCNSFHLHYQHAFIQNDFLLLYLYSFKITRGSLTVIKNGKNNFDFVQWARFWITQNVKSVKFHIFQHSVITTFSKHACPQCWYFSLYKIIQQEDGWVLQQHDACNPSYCLFHRYISMKVS